MTMQNGKCWIPHEDENRRDMASKLEGLGIKIVYTSLRYVYQVELPQGWEDRENRRSDPDISSGVIVDQTGKSRLQYYEEYSDSYDGIFWIKILE